MTRRISAVLSGHWPVWLFWYCHPHAEVRAGHRERFAIACGGENFVKVAKAANLSQAVKRAKEQGFWIAGTVVKSGAILSDVKFSFPAGLVIGWSIKACAENSLKQLAT